MKFISWNINGIRAALKKGFNDFLEDQDPDFICLQEVKATQEQVNEDFPGYHVIWNAAERKGYSGTAILSKKEPLSIIRGMDYEGDDLEDDFGDASTEGRVLTLEFEEFYLNTVYTPNSKRGLERLSFRENIWDPAYKEFIQLLQKKKPVIACGDYNVAHTPDDLARPDGNEKNHGFTKEEREGFTNLLGIGLVDTFRLFHQGNGYYSWWSPFAKSRERNVGWRIDYFLVSEELKDMVTSSEILMEQMGSDHAPVVLEMKVN